MPDSVQQIFCGDHLPVRLQLPSHSRKGSHVCSGLPNAVRRREALLRVISIATAGRLWMPPVAHGKKAVLRADGTSSEAFEFNVGLRVVSLSGSVPADWEQDFRVALKGKAKFSLERRSQLLDIFNELSESNKKKSAGNADVVSLGDVFLGPAIQQRLLQPLQHPEEQIWLSQNGEVWGVPYRWGCTLIAYRMDKVTSRRGGQPIEDWKDLLQPALRNRLGFVEAPREFMGVVFKSLGLPFNATSKQLAACGVARQDLADQVERLRAQVRQVSGREQQQALVAGDIWAAVGPSSDLISLGLRHNNIALVAPASGTALWSDLWVVPSSAKGGHMQNGPSPLVPVWMLYGLEPARANRKRGLQGGASPLLLPGAMESPACWSPPTGEMHSSRLGGAGNLDLSLGELMPSEEVLERSEFLEPLDDNMRDLYWQLLQLKS